VARNDNDSALRDLGRIPVATHRGRMEITRRDVSLDFDPARVPKDWATDPFTTTFLGALSLLFPEGENFFVSSVKQHRDQLTDPTLQREVAGFLGQEAMHGREHRLFNELLLAHGHTEAPKIEARLRWFLTRVVKRTLSPKSQLAVTCALEHFTAMLAEQLLRDGRLRNDLHPSVQPLWTWHALEEVEHKAVAFDVYRAAGARDGRRAAAGDYLRRVLIMMLTTAVFFTVHPIVHARLMARRGILWKPWTWVRGMARLWIWPAFFIRLIPAYLSYYRPGFHPGDRDATALLADWREQLFGTRGLLAEPATQPQRT
jgi:predicted metal-dependent hydrolase